MRGVLVLSRCFVLQCVITLPDADAPAQHALGFDPDARSARLNAPTGGATVVFDSFSHEHERMEWGALVDAVNEPGDASRRVPLDWSVRVSGSLSAVLGSENIAAYRALEPKTEAARPAAHRTPESNTDAASPVSAASGPESIAATLEPKAARPVVTSFDEEIEELKRHCAGLSDVPSRTQHRRAVAEALLSIHQGPGSFADVLRSGNPTPLCTPPEDEVSAAVSALCEFGRRL
jgi:hypothetical protein